VLRGTRGGGGRRWLCNLITQVIELTDDERKCVKFVVYRQVL
jgi:hypothetical protein